MPVANKANRQSTVRNALLGTALATGGVLLLAGGAQAQEAGATPPDGFTPVSGVSGVSRVEMGADGSVQLVMTDGRTVLIAAQDVSVIDGVVYLSDAALDANALLGTGVAAAGGGGGGAILGALGGLGLLGAAAGGGGGGGGGTTTPPTPPTNTNPPVFTSASTASADENVTGTVYTATATDADGNTVTFSISGGADASLFSINSSTGAVTFNAPPDFENAGDSGADNTYEITIRASDGTNTTDQTVTITVGDVDEVPVISSAATASVAENTVGTVYTAQAADPEGQALTYSLSGADAALFAIDAATGEVSFLAAPDFENPGDADGDNDYEITLSASDGSLTTDRTVTITVTDVDEGPAAFSSGTTASFNENASGVVYTAVATDPDGNAITYSLGSGGDSALFAIDSATGELTFNAPPDFEAPADGNGDNVYSVVVRASDGNTTTNQTVSVTVNDVDEAPVITSGAAASVAENSAGVVYTATASDPEGAAITYSLSGDDAALFAIDANTGEVSFLVAPDFELPLDADGDNVYDVIVTASDGSNSDVQPVSITVSNLNEFAPVFTSATTDSVDEDSTGSFYTATATDGDGDTLTYSIAGTDAALFTIDATTGALSFIASPDFENPSDDDGDNVYELQLRASDGTTTTTQNLAVTVNNVAAQPVLTSGASADFTENGSGVAYTISATDGDGDVLTYSISGADAALFSVNAATGEVSFLAAPDFESPADADGNNVYDINVTASDGGLSDTQAVSISVVDENDVAPVVTSGTTASIGENSNAVFYTATATNVDGPFTRFELGGPDSQHLSLNSVTGELSFDSPFPDFENPADSNGDNVYEVTITAYDGDFQDTITLAITVTDVDEGSGGSPVFSSGTSQTISENQTSAYVARAVDPNGDTVSYSISGTDAALFTIDSASGEVRFLATPDFESPTDAGGDNVYDFTVTASDGSNTANRAVSVTVGDVTNESSDVPEGDTTQISMVSGGNYTGTLEVAGDRDWIEVTLEAGQRYQFDAFGSGGTGVELEDTYLRLYDASGDLIAENDDITLGVNTDSRLGFTATTSGTYYISVGAWEPDSGATLSGQYELQIRHTDPLTAWNYQEIGDYLNANGFGGLQWDRSAGDTITVDVTGLTTAGRTLARAALQLWEDITGITFTEVSSGGDITFDDEEEGAFAGPDSTSGGFITSASVNVGTEWLSTYGTNLDGYSFQTYIHEIGHALGLGHGGPYDGSADYAIDAIYLNDSWQATVMSYFSQNENTYVDADFGYVVGPQVADIIAVLDMYGGSTSTRGGNTVYGYNSTAGNVIFDATAFSNPVSFTIFDTGGIDTLDYSGSSSNQIFDLREQAYSSLNGRDGNIGIARGTVIENAIGGSGNDIFVGNSADNTITGNGGADRYYASGGSDVFNGGSGNDTIVFSGASTDYTISTNGSGNTVVTDNRAGSPDGVVELISVESIVYDGETSNPEYFGDPDHAGREGLDPDNLPELAPHHPEITGDDWSHPIMSDHGDAKDDGHEPHTYPDLSDADLALLENLSLESGDSRGWVGALRDLLDVDASGGLVRAYVADGELETAAALGADKGYPVFEPLTLPSGDQSAAPQSAGAGNAALEHFPDGRFIDAFDVREALMPTLTDDSQDGWA
ncbi:cadherin domain-containing protein [Maricaulis sp.]|uniref:cadherin domain-containing protein n=1 Tax=Maricaulis sp. TaxID=1486257 RepID=UPI0025BBA428|nr:cadherin domain-containing protein [Maricaulis sp.]